VIRDIVTDVTHIKNAWHKKNNPDRGFLYQEKLLLVHKIGRLANKELRFVIEVAGGWVGEPLVCEQPTEFY